MLRWQLKRSLLLEIWLRVFNIFPAVGKGGQSFGPFFCFGSVRFLLCSLFTFQLQYPLSYTFSRTYDPSVLFEWARIQQFETVRYC
jgi:hypothetical protein